ncbi:replication initiator protein A [Streptococcus anginosus]|uniref:replication initiator protein A n=1 Tax=Streptococcus anginosus TaxID=1328 RepID=UPI000D093E39|nr:replication initiator protein A [Streptococcus anginosus]PRT72342.1 replication initiator protein A [Streptococcus anginosus]
MNYLTAMSDIPEFATATLDIDQHYVPRPLMENYLKDFKSNGVMAYSLLLNRLREPFDSIHKGQDDNGNIFVYFPNEELAEALNCSYSTVVSVKKLLTQKHLIEEVRQGFGKPNRIYLTDEILSYYQ